MFADGLEHLDRDNVVELAEKIAIVGQLQVGAVAQASARQALIGVGQLFRGEREAGDVQAEFVNRDFREATPAAADLEQAFSGLGAECAQGAANLLVLGRRQILAVPFGEEGA